MQITEFRAYVVTSQQVGVKIKQTQEKVPSSCSCRRLLSEDDSQPCHWVSSRQQGICFQWWLLGWLLMEHCLGAGVVFLHLTVVPLLALWILSPRAGVHKPFSFPLASLTSRLFCPKPSAGAPVLCWVLPAEYCCSAQIYGWWCEASLLAEAPAFEEL